MSLSVQHLQRCIQTLESSLELLQNEKKDTVHYEVYRNAIIKGFELTLETSGKLLRKALKAYGSTPKMVDQLFYKDILRHAGKHGLLEADAIERWFIYTDNRNDTAHDYGESFAAHTLSIIPKFIDDAKALALTLEKTFRNFIDA